MHVRMQPTTVYKFGGSSVADAGRMREVAEIMCAFPEEHPVIVMSAMGKSTNLLLEAGAAAIARGTVAIPGLSSLRALKELHRDACSKLECDSETVSSVERLLTELQQLLTGIAIMQVRCRPLRHLACSCLVHLVEFLPVLVAAFPMIHPFLSCTFDKDTLPEHGRSHCNQDVHALALALLCSGSSGSLLALLCSGTCFACLLALLWQSTHLRCTSSVLYRKLSCPWFAPRALHP